jgi:hypothetical protein
MKIINEVASGGDVGKALANVVKKVNRELKKVDGKITKIEPDISAGPSGAYVGISVAVTGFQPRRKRIIGINERGRTRADSMRKASSKLNSFLASKRGEVVDIYTKTTTSPIPGRAYTTIIAAINEDEIETYADANLRRQRLKRSLKLLENDPSTINVSRVAKIFGVSRIVIYKDLEELGFTRTSLKGSR